MAYRQRRVEQRRRVVLNKRQVCIDRGGEWELITVMLIEQPHRHVPPAYDVILERHIDRYPISDTETLDSHAGNKYKVQRRALSRKELLALPIPVEWLP